MKVRVILNSQTSIQQMTHGEYDVLKSVDEIWRDDSNAINNVEWLTRKVTDSMKSISVKLPSIRIKNKPKKMHQKNKV